MEVATFKVRAAIQADRLRELLDYDPGTGVFVRRKNLGGIHKGSNAGSISREGYLRIQLDGKKYLCHRLAWLYIYGRWPIDQLDHINGIRSDNRIENLRECSNSENSQNVRAHKDGAGMLGATWDKRCGKWLSQICVNGKKIFLGRFDAQEKAHSAYLKAKYQYHGFGVNHGNISNEG